MSDTVHCGVHGPLEDEADRLLHESLKGVTSQSAKSDILTPWKQQDRWSREVMANAGVIDPAIRKGMYHRVANKTLPHLNSRDGHTRASRFADRRFRDDWTEPNE